MPSAIARSSLIRGPGRLKYGASQYLYSKGDIRTKVDLAPFQIEADHAGIVDVRVGNRVAEVSFQPAGNLTTGIVNVLYPLSGSGVSSFIGASVFGATDSALEICDVSGRQVIFKSAHVTKMPDLICSATKTVFGDTTFNCLATDNTVWATDNTFASTGVAGAFNASGFGVTDIFTDGFTVAWGAVAPWATIATPEGVTLSFEQEIQPVMDDAEGIIDYTYGNLIVRARLTMLNASEHDLMAKILPYVQGAAAGRGKSLSAMAQTLTLTSGHLTVTIPNMLIDTPSFRHQRVSPRLVDLNFRSVIQGTSAPFTMTVA